MTRTVDGATDDLFGRFPQPVDLTSPTTDLRLMIATRMSAAMKAFAAEQEKKNQPGDRYEVAARMSRIYGREVTKHILDAYAAGSKDSHVPNLAFAIAFDRATEQRELLKLFADLCGCGVLVGSDNLRAELVMVQLQAEELRKQERALKRAIRSTPR
jgi:hypothetical protein